MEKAAFQAATRNQGVAVAENVMLCPESATVAVELPYLLKEQLLSAFRRQVELSNKFFQREFFSELSGSRHPSFSVG